jgi:hypothetical protein
MTDYIGTELASMTTEHQSHPITTLSFIAAAASPYFLQFDQQ